MQVLFGWQAFLDSGEDIPSKELRELGVYKVASPPPSYLSGLIDKKLVVLSCSNCVAPKFKVLGRAEEFFLDWENVVPDRTSIHE